MKKLKLVMSIATMCLAIAVLCFGVLAATSVTYTIQGTISYDVEDVYVDVNTTVYKSVQYLSATEQSRLVDTLGDPANLTTAKTTYGLVETGVSYSFSTVNNFTPAKSGLSFNFDLETKTYVIVTNVKNLTNKNAWAVVDSIKVNDSFVAYYELDPNINVRDNYQLSISKEDDTNGRNVVIAVSPKDVTQPLTSSTFSFNLIFGSGEYVHSKTNTDKMKITDNGDGTKTVEMANEEISGVLAIPNGVVTIGVDAFMGNITSVIIPEGVTTLENCALYFWNLTSITIPNSLKNCDEDVFSDTPISGKRVYISNLDNWFNITFNGGYSNPLSGGSDLYVNGTILTDLVIPDGVTSIGESAFSGCSSLTSIEISSSVTSIGGWAFNGCSNLTSITIPSSVTSIGDGAFSGCSSLTSIEIPSSVTSIAYCAFSDCSELTSITIPSSVTNIGDSAFSWCRNLTSITIPSSVTSIGDNAFYNTPWLANLTADSNGLKIVTSSDNANVKFLLGYTGSLATITAEMLSGVQVIYDHVFSGNTTLQSITIPSSVTSIGGWAFYNCINLNSVTFDAGSKLTSIGDSAFSWCRNLTSITIPSGVTSIESSAFSGCSRLTSFTIPSSVTSIGSSAFSECSSLTSITIPSSVTSIESYAFYNCRSLTSIEIPSSVTSIESYAFDRCSSLTTINFMGTQAQWNAISKSSAKIKAGVNVVCTDGTIVTA